MAVAITDLRTCEDEPIHVPGSIQAHGLLLAIDGDDRITHAAFGDHAGLLTTNDPIGLPLSEAAPRLAELVRSAQPGRRIALDDDATTLTMHHSPQGVRIIEIEPDTPVVTKPRDAVQQVLSAATVEGVLESAVRVIRELTGHDRVLAYLFDRDFNGTVVAEDQRAGIDSYLHQSFPKSDIPPQALRLYRRKLIRVIADTRAETLAIRCGANRTNADAGGERGNALDLSDADLRSVSPIHIEYLENMGVRATLVGSLICDDRFFGMIACHHLSPMHVGPALRDAVAEVVAAASLRIDTIRTRELERRRLESFKKCSSILVELAEDQASEAALARHAEQLRMLFDAEGAALILGDAVVTSGTTPSPMDVRRVSTALSRQGDGIVQQSEHLASLDADFASFAGAAAGALRTPIGGGTGDAVVWFKPEVRRSITWAGNPADSVLKAEAGQRLSPRASFEAYVERVEAHSTPWADWELEVADAVRGLISSIARRMSSLHELADQRRVAAEEMQGARDAAVAATEAKSMFLANMSHEIRTPMTAILGFAELLASDPEHRSGGPRFDHAVSAIRASGEHLLSLINDILDLSKVEAGRLETESIDTHPVDVIRRAMSVVRHRAEEKGIDLRAEFETPIPRTIRTDPTRLKQVLVNLLGNAVKFTERGSVVVGVGYDAGDRRLIVRVRDTGVGMTPEQLERIREFRPFTQADTSTTRRFGGTGLGLTISHMVAGLLGGGLEVESEPGAGSTFTLRIAAGEIADEVILSPEDALSDLETAEADHHSDVASDGTPLAGVRVLLAEDAVENQRLITFHLEKAGASVAVAENGREAVAAVEGAPVGGAFDLVLMDVQMPEMDGHEAARRLRRGGYRLPIIALTAHAMADDRQRSLEAGCDDHVTKPIDREALIRACVFWSRGSVERSA